MRKVCALMIVALLAGAALPDPASAQPSWQYGWWHPGPGGPRWVGAWGPRGRWVRGSRGVWVYRSPAPAWRYSRWVRGPGGRWGWGGGWGPGGTWVRHRGGWAYRWR